MMGAVNVLQLVLLVWTFTAVCEADDDAYIITCEDVTGHVGEKIYLTCDVSYKNNKPCMKNYKFKANDGSVICKDDFKSETDCIQLNTIVCHYTANEKMIRTFQIFVQTTHGYKTTDFSVNITDAVAVASNKDAQVDEAIMETNDQTSSSKRVHLAIIPFIICLIVITGIILKKKPNLTSGFQMGLCINNNIEHSDETG